MKDTEKSDGSNLETPDSSSGKTKRTWSRVLATVAMAMLFAIIVGMILFVFVVPIWLYIIGDVGLVFVGVAITSGGLSLYMLREIIYRLKDELNIKGELNGEQPI